MPGKPLMRIHRIALALALSAGPCLGQEAAKTDVSAPVRSARRAKPKIEWVTIPGGSFMMGADDVGSGAKPRHAVTVKAFEMSKTLVTNKQYRACVRAEFCAPPDETGDKFKGDEQPAVGVDWEQARDFAKWAGGRLPTEAEWEYAARGGGKEQKYPWGDDEPTCELAVFDPGARGCGKSSTWPVCSKPKGNTNQGLCDMAGNVWEWVQDWYHDSYNGAPADARAWESPPGSYRVVRGGSCYRDARFLRAAVRYYNDPGYRHESFGFRLARDLKP